MNSCKKVSNNSKLSLIQTQIIKFNICIYVKQIPKMSNIFFRRFFYKRALLYDGELNKIILLTQKNPAQQLI